MNASYIGIMSQMIDSMRDIVHVNAPCLGRPFMVAAQLKQVKCFGRLHRRACVGCRRIRLDRGGPTRGGSGEILEGGTAVNIG